METLENNTALSSGSSYDDALGEVDVVSEIPDFEAGKVELSIPQKYISVPKPKKPNPYAKVKPEPLSKGKAVPVFHSETYVDEDGVEHMIPPTYDKSQMNLPQSRYKISDSPNYEGERVDMEAVADTPDFLKTWQDDNSAAEIDKAVNEALDNDAPVEYVHAGDENSGVDNVSVNDDAIVNNKEVLGGEVSVMKEPAATQSFEVTENGEIDLENLDAIIAAHTPHEEEVEVKNLSSDDTLFASGGAVNMHTIPKFSLDDENVDTADDGKDVSQKVNATQLDGPVGNENEVMFLEPDDDDHVFDDLGKETAEPISVDDLVGIDETGEAHSFIDDDLAIEPEAVQEAAEVAEESGLADAIETEPEVASEVGQEVSFDETEPETVQEVGQEVTFDEAESEVASEVGQEVSFDETEPEVASEVGQEVTFEEAEPEAASEVAQDVTFDEAESEIASEVAQDVTFEEAGSEAVGEAEFVNTQSSNQSAIYLENLAAQSYSLGSLENYLQVTAHDLPEQFVADDVQNSIQINAGNSDYGWSVIFDSGVVMGMCDVKEYQLRNGKLPTPNGALCYGFKRMNFSGVQKIVCYEVPRYFSYIR